MGTSDVTSEIRIFKPNLKQLPVSRGGYSHIHVAAVPRLKYTPSCEEWSFSKSHDVAELVFNGKWQNELLKGSWAVTRGEGDYGIGGQTPGDKYGDERLWF